MKRSIEDCLLKDGINTTMLAKEDGELFLAWELRTKLGIFVGETCRELIDDIHKSGLECNVLTLSSIVGLLEQDGLEVIAQEDMEDIMAR